MDACPLSAFEDHRCVDLMCNFGSLFALPVALLGIALLVSLLRLTGPSRVADQIKTVAWGLGLIIVLGGISHLTKTLAWRLTFLCDIRDVSFARTFGLRPCRIDPGTMPTSTVSFLEGLGLLCLIAMSRSAQQARRDRPLAFCAEPGQARS